MYSQKNPNYKYLQIHCGTIFLSSITFQQAAFWVYRGLSAFRKKLNSDRKRKMTSIKQTRLLYILTFYFCYDFQNISNKEGWHFLDKVKTYFCFQENSILLERQFRFSGGSFMFHTHLRFFY